MHKRRRCDKCKLKPQCVSLCDIANGYADQDYVSQREFLHGLPIDVWVEDFCSMQTDCCEPEYTPIEKSILTLLLRGKTVEKICELLKITRNSFRVHFYNIRRKS
jgi:DNA-binding NarL/FixJ family response regulator